MPLLRGKVISIEPDLLHVFRFPKFLAHQVEVANKVKAELIVRILLVAVLEIDDITTDIEGYRRDDTAKKSSFLKYHFPIFTMEFQGKKT